jgi:hypothetical protein
MRLSRNLAGASSALSSRSHLPTHQQTAGAQRTLAGGSRPFWGGPLGGIFKTYGRGCARDASGRRTEGGRKVDGRWSADAGLRVEFKTSPSPCPAAVQRVLSGFSAGFQKVLGRCPICRLARKWLDLDPFPAGAGGATHVRCPYGADRDSGRARGVSPIPEFGGLP